MTELARFRAGRVLVVTLSALTLAHLLERPAGRLALAAAGLHVAALGVWLGVVLLLAAAAGIVAASLLPGRLTR